MSIRDLTLACAVAITAVPLAAQSNEPERTSAALPERLEGTDERAPMTPPRSSANEVGVIDPAANRFGIGQTATEEEIAVIDIDAMPDGRGLPAGSGTYAEGEQVYSETCAACHGSDLQGISDLGAPRLIGGRGTLADDSPIKTVESYWPYASTLFDYVHRSMPMNSPGSLTAEQVYAVSAYILGRSGIIDDDPEASLDAESLPDIEMPNVDGFVPDPRPDVSMSE